MAPKRKQKSSTATAAATTAEYVLGKRVKRERDPNIMTHEQNQLALITSKRFDTPLTIVLFRANAEFTLCQDDSLTSRPEKGTAIRGLKKIRFDVVIAGNLSASMRASVFTVSRFKQLCGKDSPPMIDCPRGFVWGGISKTEVCHECSMTQSFLEETLNSRDLIHADSVGKTITNMPRVLCILIYSYICEWRDADKQWVEIDYE